MHNSDFLLLWNTVFQHSIKIFYFLCDIKRQLAQPCVVKWWINEPWIDLFSIGMFKTGTALVQTNYWKLFNPSLLNLSSWKSCWDMKIRHASQCDMFFFNMPVLSRLKSWHLQLKIFSFVECDCHVCYCRSTVWLSTAPTEPLTRWYQVRCLLQTPLFAKQGQTLSGTVLLVYNNRYTRGHLC